MEANKKRLSRLAKFFAIGSIVFSFIIQSQNAIVLQYELINPRLMPVIIFIFPVFLLLGAINNAEVLNSTLRRDKYIPIFSLGMILVFSIGVFRGNDLRNIALDFVGSSVVLAAYLNGVSFAFWKESVTPILVLLSAIFLIAIESTSIQDVIRDRSLLGEQAGYRVAAGLFVAPLWAMILAGVKHPFQFYWAIALSLGGLYLQSVFAKRLGTTHLLILIFMAVVVAPSWHARRRRGILVAAVVSSAVIAIAAWAGFGRTMDRFVERGDFKSTLTSGNERIGEAEDLLSSLTVSDWLFGRGFGGGFNSETIDNARSLIGTDGGDSERQEIHIGFLYPLLKGGIVWSLIYFWPIRFLIRGLRSFDRADSITRSCLVWGLVYYLFQILEGAVTYSSSMDALVLGLALGRIRAFNIKLEKSVNRFIPHTVGKI